MPERRRKYTPEFKDEAARMVVETSRPIAEVACEIHVNPGTLGHWVAKYRVDHAGEEPPLSITERARLRELEKENRELRMKAQFLGKSGSLLRPRQCCFEHSDQTYGYRRVDALLIRQGEQVSPELVRELMRDLGLVACQPRPYRPTTSAPN